MAITLTTLDEAQAAYHKLMTGQAVASFKDQNGEQVTYEKANHGKLAVYIEFLKRELGLLTTGTGPMEPWF